MKIFLIILASIVALLLLVGIFRALIYPASQNPNRNHNWLLDIILIDQWMSIGDGSDTFSDSSDSDFD